MFVYGSRGALGLLLHPWQEQFGASRGAVSLVSSFGFVALGLGQPIAGRLLESFDARRVVVVGAAISAAGFGGAAYASELWLAILLAGVVAAFGAGLASLSALSYAAAELVEHRQGAVFGVLTAAAAGGQVVVLPLVTVALGVSLRAALLFLAVTLAAATAALHLLLPPIRPARRREEPSGTALGILGERPFWLLAVPFFVCGFTTTGLIDTHLVPYAVDHHVGEATASGALATLAAFNTIGVLIAGALTDRVDRGRMLAVVYAARGVSLLFLPFVTTPAGLFAFAVVFGLADFATVPPTTSLTRSLFRSGGWALALGLVFGAHQAGAALGAWLGGWLQDLTGTYHLSLLSAAVTLALASLLSYALREPRSSDLTDEAGPALTRACTPTPAPAKAAAGSLAASAAARSNAKRST